MTEYITIVQLNAPLTVIRTITMNNNNFHFNHKLHQFVWQK